ncbi:MAG: aldo/keto reductase [Oscillospiraceae bacterium]|nr:aldo/keto reductase [Oscillospiraceae bacterium]
MLYNDFQNTKLSALGMGCMRLPVLESFDRIDMAAAKEMVSYAMKNGINYYDTAWGYHAGRSETAMGEILEAYPRESYYLATKFPGYDLSNMGKVAEIFTEQLKKCRTEYFDFYLFHNVCELNIDGYLDPENGIFEYLMEQKKNGRIRHLGFSVHGTLETMKRFLNAYGEHMEFCQIQLNWLDWDFQNAKAKVELLNAYGIPIWVMEPVRGGSLAALPPERETVLKALHPEWSCVEWAFRFLQSIPGVTVTLSGMSSFRQLQENITTFESGQPLSEAETAVLLDIAQKMTSQKTLPCTGCRYCTAHCPQELDIPRLIELYNEYTYSNGGFIAPAAVNAMDDSKKPSACLGCQACEAVCPQNIRISKMMADFSASLS